MARRHLHQDLTTRKLSSLPDDLKKIAEELVGDKFGYEEEVVERKSSASFPGYVGEGSVVDDRFVGAIYESNMGYVRMEHTFGHGLSARLDYSTRRRIVSSPIERCSTRGIMDAIQRLDRENLPRSNRVIRMGIGFWNELRRDEDLHRFMGYRRYSEDFMRGTREHLEYVGDMFGCKMVVGEGIATEVEVSF